jgi:glycine/D-amino acid oxidase-like deaminating enzyme
MPTPALPRDEQTCGWIASLPPLAPARRLRTNETADAVVIGAGFTGLAAARQLARHRPDWRVVILEARRAGSGASGRNSGFVVDLPHFNPSREVEQNRRLLRLSREGWRLLREQVRGRAIECGWTENGRLHAAAGDLGQRALDQFVSVLTAIGEPFAWLEREGVAAITGTAYYRAAVRTTGGATMQPGALMRGLVASLPENVELFEESAVRSIGRRGWFEIVAGEGALRAPRLLLATNGYTPGLGFLKRQLFPLLTFGSLTRVLTAEEQSRLGGERAWGVVSEVQMGTTVRRTPEQRILIRNTVHYTRRLQVERGQREQIRVEHERALGLRFPMLGRIPFEYTWSGVMGVSFNGMPYFGRLEDGLFAAAGFNGVGVALGTVCGTLLADLVTGADSPLLDDARALPRPSWIPPEPLLGVGVRATLTRLMAKAQEEL